MSQKKDNDLFKKSTKQILNIIFRQPNKSFYIRNLARLSKLSTTAVIDTTKLLQSLNIIKIEKTEITTNIKANLESETFSTYKRIFNLYSIEENNLTQLLNKELTPTAIVLFGSYSKGEDIEESDIDILVISNKKTTKTIEKSLEKIEKELKRNINLQILPSLEKSSEEFKNAVSNGIVLQGYAKVV
jgi:uncharacterized protein